MVTIRNPADRVVVRDCAIHARDRSEVRNNPRRAN
jgi:hypothetical protein